MVERGVIYYAAGERYVEQAKQSAQSLKEHNDLHVTVYSDRSNIERDCIDQVIQIEPGKDPFYDRINYFKETPYDKTLHLDTDTLVVGKIIDIFESLDRFSVVAAFNESRNTVSEEHKFETIDIDAPDSFPEYQCGVIGFRDSPEVQRLFSDWQDRYADYRDQFVLDQPHFREALYQNEVKLGTLPSEYNLLVYFGGYIQQEAKIIHYAGTEPEKLPSLLGTDSSLDQTVEKINGDAPETRVLFYDGWNKLRVVPTTGNGHLLFRAARSLLRDGLFSTIKNGYEKLSEQK